MKNALIALAVVLLVSTGGYFVWQSRVDRERFPNAPAADDVSVTMHTSGGFCAAPGCPPHTFVITKSGVRKDGGAPRPISAAQYERFASLVRNLDEGDFPKKAEGRLCPSAYDAIDVQYEFDTGSGLIRADNCEDEVSPGHPLIAFINELIYQE